MRLRWYDRILVALSGVVLAVLGAGVILCGCGVIRLPQGIALDLWTGQDWKWLPVIFLGGLLLFVWGVHLIVRPLCPKRDLHGRYFTVKTNGEDTLSISVSALDQLVRKCLDAHPEVPAEPHEEPAEETTAEVAEEPPVQTAEPSTAPEETAETSPELTQQEIYAQREAAEMGAFTVDFGPKDPLPVELSADAFPFPSKNEETPSQEEEKNA